MKINVHCVSESHEDSVEMPISASNHRLEVYTEITVLQKVGSLQNAEQPLPHCHGIVSSNVWSLVDSRSEPVVAMIPLLISLLTFHLFYSCRFSLGSITIMVGWCMSRKHVVRRAENYGHKACLNYTLVVFSWKSL